MQNKTGIFFILLVLLLFALPACKGKSSDKTQLGPRLTVKQSSFNLGVIKIGGDKISISTTIQNEGDVLLHITNLTTSCDCTTATLSATTLKPGGKATLEISYTPEPPGKIQAGDILRTVSLFSNDPQNPEVIIFIEAILK